MCLQNIVCVFVTNIVTNIDTHKQTNTQGENIITSLTRVIINPVTWKYDSGIISSMIYVPMV